ncbi:MAG: radical SAM family heme chaperone HemW [Melioribacteraceae bacterium]|nr:radical SAM family heme chaperone HemW [Melioribacteraceae bacterium]
MKETSIYIHIPFCDHKCIYCDFYSIINHENTTSYLFALKKEIEFFAKNFSNDRKIISVFFGGGTPSLMEAGYINEIIIHLKNNFYLNEEVEITLETNPGTVDKNKLEEFIKIGINRLSVGVQSFDKDDLKFLTRIHDSQTAIQTIKDAYSIGFGNINLDLIFNLPNQTKEKWLKNLEISMELPIKHISTYSLILEKGTILNKMVLDGKVKIQDEEHDAELYETTIDFLTKNNFIQYEVSNFAKEGYECIHNNSYWHYKDYLGFGTSAHSFVNGKRWWNYSSTKFYIESIKSKNHAIIGEETLNKSEMQNEFVMLALRSSGLNLSLLNKNFGNDWLIKNNDIINLLIENKLMIKKDDKLFLTSKGFAICDEILAKFV